ncbi:MAG TPA: hypothetical protein VF587_15990 [Solirubrobacteraceae bacterium]
MFDKIKGAQAQAQEAMKGAGGMGGMGGMGGGMPGMDMGAQAAEAQKMQKIAQAGVEAPGVIHTIAPTGQTEFGGGQKVNFEVSIRPATGDPFQTTITQSMLPAQMEGLSEGQAITVKYDPDAPAVALIYGW